MNNRTERRWSELCSILSPEDRNSAGQLFSQCYQRCYMKERNDKCGKFAFLREEAETAAHKKLWPNKQFRDSLIVNQTDTVFSESELDILALGPKFAIHPTKIPVTDFIVGVETILQHFPNGGQAIAASVARLLRTGIRSTKQNLSTNHLNAMRSIKVKLKSTGCILLPADKGAKTVVMKRDEYMSKVKEQLSEKLLYEKQRKNCNPILRTRAILKPLMELLNCDSSVLMSEQSAKISIPYGLPKIHKQGSPLRLIIPMVGTVSYYLSKQLDRLLRPIVDSLERRIKSADHLLQKLANLDVSSTMFMGSLDVVALFPNVSIPFLLSKLPTFLKAKESLWRDEDLPLGHLSADNVTQLIKGLCDSTFFKFDGQSYKQLNGVPMGSPVSVTLSEIFMHFIESDAFENCPTEFCPLYYGRYIDDILVISRDSHSFSNFHQHISGSARNLLSFTKEEEINERLPFLDILLSHENGHFEFSVYRKATHSNRYCNPSSAVPRSVFTSTVRTMRLRAQKYCSTAEKFAAEMKLLHSTFRNNNYDKNLLNHHLKTPVFGPVKPSPMANVKAIIPFAGSVSYKIRSLLANVGVRVYFKSPAMLGTMLYRKLDWEKKSPLDQSNVVYKARCNDCRVVYIGETKRTLRTRGKEHLSHIRSRDCAHSALSEHCITHAHRVDLTNFEVIEREPFCFKRRVKESFHIAANLDACNNKSMSVQISNPWLSLCKFAR
ncbi:MAG: hypothetical protein GY820_21020 [Gammaproteobacteria bacterium]|nr:hypothetical protein [Gammaproteobacteria bacterium]